MADLLSISSIRERIFNPTKHEKTVARTSNPFAQTSFKGNVLTADVFVSENAKEKQGNAINFTGKLKASALVGSISDFGNKIKAGIESAVNFAKRIVEYPINFWNKLSETEVTFEPAINAMSKAGEKFGEALKMDASVVGAKAGEVLSEEYIATRDPKYISPDGSLDISTCLFPDNVWFFQGQHHEVGRNDVIIKLIAKLASNQINSTADMPDKFPQFNGNRNTKNITRWCFEDADRVFAEYAEDPTLYNAEDIEELRAVYEEAEEYLENVA